MARNGRCHPYPPGTGRAILTPCPRSETIDVPETANPVPATAVLLTRAGEQELRARLAALREEIEVELPRRLRLAREFGDATGNDDYLQILEEEAVASARMRSLAAVLAAARVVDDADAAGDVAMVGSTVTIRTDGRTVERRLVGAFEAGGDAVSASSPIGRAILGRAAGERVVAALPSGAEQEIEIVAVAASGPEPIAA